VQVESHATCLETDQKQFRVRIVLELLDSCFPIAGSTVEISVRNFRRVEAGADNRKEAGELRKYQNLMIFLQHLIELRQQSIELSTPLFDPSLIDQSGMARHLAQAQQRFQDLQLELTDST
jgi:hypothetical protein